MAVFTAITSKGHPEVYLSKSEQALGPYLPLSMLHSFGEHGLPTGIDNSDVVVFQSGEFAGQQAIPTRALAKKEPLPHSGQVFVREGSR